MTRVRCYSAVVPVKTTKASGQTVLTEAGVAVQGSGGAETKTVT
jgi:hypothetical protein